MTKSVADNGHQQNGNIRRTVISTIEYSAIDEGLKGGSFEIEKERKKKGSM